VFSGGGINEWCVFGHSHTLLTVSGVTILIESELKKELTEVYNFIRQKSVSRLTRSS